MKVRNIETGEVETLRHGPATEAVNAGTHEFVNDDPADDAKTVEGADKRKTARTSNAGSGSLS